jgi:hypothetical protein
MAAMTAIAETPATASRRLCLRADVGDWALILVIMMCSFDVIGVRVEPLTQAGAPSPAKGDTFSRIDLWGPAPTKFGEYAKKTSVSSLCDEAVSRNRRNQLRIARRSGQLAGGRPANVHLPAVSR